MFGFSVSKLLVLAGIVAAVWYGFKFVGRLEQARKDAAKTGKTTASGGAAASANSAAARDAEEMISCPVCGDYVAAQGASACDRTDCPQAV